MARLLEHLWILLVSEPRESWPGSGHQRQVLLLVQVLVVAMGWPQRPLWSLAVLSVFVAWSPLGQLVLGVRQSAGGRPNVPGTVRATLELGVAHQVVPGRGAVIGLSLIHI